ncbi:MAG: (Fe-S)-binding protein [Planctomycetota bacterium]|jgi:glycolate oxidase iron-sulfur subunit
MDLDLRELSRPCVHCGICLDACPTYRVLKEEADSPRGRIFLLEALLDGRVDPADVQPHIDRCVGCRACETACPSGVPYGAILEHGRARLGGPPWLVRALLRHVVTRPWAARLIVALGRVAGRFPPREAPAAWPDPPSRPRARVALHLGCVLPALFPALAADTARVLTRLGFHVEVPSGQGCCGALQRHAGLDDAALRERNERAFRGYDIVVSAAAGCSATPGLTDVCALLLDESLAGRLEPVTVAYDAPCHLLHGQGIDASRLLDSIEGVTRVELEGDDRCCGAGGLYMEREPELARAVREEKLDAIERSGARVVTTPNPGCMVWLWRGLRERGSAVEVVHPVTLLARAGG